VGLSIGLAAADGPFALSDGVFRHGPGLLIGIVGLVAFTGIIACGLPLKRALRIQPTDALRAEGRCGSRRWALVSLASVPYRTSTGVEMA
jgi:hypothetical protein